MKKQDFGELLAEAVAVFIIIAFGDSVAAMYSLYNPSPYLNSYWGVCMAWGLAVTMAIYATGSISGTHANPAVTLALALYRKFSWRKVIPYVVAQVIGGILGAGVVYILYVPVIDHFNQAAQLTRASRTARPTPPAATPASRLSRILYATPPRADWVGSRSSDRTVAW